jgi:hypothetical protein
MDLIATEVPADQDPVIVVLDVGWMSRLMNQNRESFKTLVDSLYNTEMYDLHDIDYLDTNNGHNSSEETLLKWESNLQEMLSDMPHSSNTWEWIKHNVPKTVLEGYDMGIGGEDHGQCWMDMVDGIGHGIERVVLITDEISMHSAAASIDDDKTINLKIREVIEADDGVMDITPWVDGVVEEWGMGHGIIPAGGSGHIPKALYRVMKLSELREYPNSINYHTLKI